MHMIIFCKVITTDFSLCKSEAKRRRDVAKEDQQTKNVTKKTMQKIMIQKYLRVKEGVAKGGRGTIGCGLEEVAATVT